MARGDDLFTAAAEEHLASQAPLAARLRPRRLDDIVGQEQLVGQGRPLRVLVEGDRLSSVILWGPPGTGKTTLAQVIAQHTAKAYEQLSAVTATVKDVREAVARAEQRLGERGLGTILFLDEVHRFNKAQQDALLPSVESGLLILVGATTENPYFEVNAPLMTPVDAVPAAAARAGGDRRAAAPGPRRRGRHRRRRGRRPPGRAAGRRRAPRPHQPGGGGRPGPGAGGRGGGVRPRPADVTVADAEAALGTKVQRYGRDDHYDVVSAFIKSIRGSDPQAALHWLARMLEAGEDARFIARRLVILASEDVGEADPQGLVVATAAAHAVEFVGLPEAQLNLAQAVGPPGHGPEVEPGGARHLAGPGRGGQGRRAARCRSTCATPTTGAPRSLGHGKGYDYPHDDPRGWVPQQLPPRRDAGRRLLRPSPHGFEQEIADAHATVGRRGPRALRAGERRRVSATDLAAVIVAGARRGRGPAGRGDDRPGPHAAGAARRRRPAPHRDGPGPRRPARDRRRANLELERLDRLVTTAESVTGTVDSASRLAYLAMANPVIKGVAFASGTAKAARRLRGRKAGAEAEG